MLYDELIELWEKHPYHGGHTALIYMCCCEYDDETEIYCVMDKSIAKQIAFVERLAKSDFDYWLKNEYTSYDSEIIIKQAIQRNAVLKIWR